MKSLAEFIKESSQQFPIIIAEWNDSEEDAEIMCEDTKDALFEIFEESGAQSIVMYTSNSKKRMDGLMYEEVFEDAEAAWKHITKRNWGGVILTLEDYTLIGITYIVSGPRQAPSEYFYFSKLAKSDIEEMIEEEDGEVEADKTYIEISKFV